MKFFDRLKGRIFNLYLSIVGGALCLLKNVEESFWTY